MDLADRIRAAVADRYVVERELGRGGMAVVYLARDLRHERRVAIKVLRPELSVTLVADRFLRETQIAAKLQHPLIVPLYDSGGTDELLWYVMPFIEGETLRERLQREKQLVLEDALRITQDAALALQCAHDHGFIHRDIKPENILLSGGHALLADFGIARALTRAAGEGTSSGVAIGTPAYMSPEQGASSPNIDARSDIYSLACVLYEMLAGEPPFTGPTPQAVIARHVSQAAPSLRVVRPSVTPGLEEAVQKALAKVPADRFETVTAFADALVIGAAAKPVPPAVRWLPAASVLAIAAVAGVWAVRGRTGDGGVAADTSRYVIVPFDRDSMVPVALNAEQLLHDAVTRWEGIVVADAFQVRDALARLGRRGPLSGQDAQRLAKMLGAGRYFRGQVTRAGDSLRVQATLYDGTTGSLGEATAKVDPSAARAEAAFASLADRLLLRRAGPALRGGPETRTRSLPARQAFVQGQEAIERWDLVAADSAFATAARYDAAYADAPLWLAQARFWAAASPATWRSAAERAAAGRAQLSSRDRMLSDALVAFARGETEHACSTWGRMAARDQFDFAAWYGWANCLSSDRVVLRDATSPSGWRFRSSYHRALKAYQRAFELLPSIHRSLRNDSYQQVRRLLLIGGNVFRGGRALAPDTITFAASPEWLADTLALVPFPFSDFWQVRGATVPPTLNEAIGRLRERFHEIATSWVVAFPRSPDAIEALAVSLELLGDPSCLDTLRRARALEPSPDARMRLAGSEVWVRLKFALPLDLGGLRAARALADSVLRDAPGGTSPDPGLLSSLAALTGRTGAAVNLARQPRAVAERQAPPVLSPAAPGLLVYAALGGPADSLDVLERIVRSAIDNALSPSERPLARLQWLGRPATLAFPDHRLASIEALEGKGYYLVDALAAFQRRDTLGAREILSRIRTTRRSLRPADLSMDALYPEAWLLTSLGDVRGAIEWLAPTLDALAATAPQAFSDPVRAGALVRSMVLRAELAARVHDQAAARKWAQIVAVLWSDADPFLTPVVRRMERLAEEGQETPTSRRE